MDGIDKFKFVNLKLKSLEEDSKLLQIIDMSQEIFYNEKKAQENFLQISHTTLSHKLKNPLSSLIGQQSNIGDLIAEQRLILTSKVKQERLEEVH